MFGRVIYPKGEMPESVGRAVVQVVKEDKSFGRSMNSDKKGNYVISKLPPGKYNVYVIGKGGQTFKGKVELKKNKRLDFKLKPYEENR